MMHFRLPLFATIALLGLASQSQAAMIMAPVSGSVSLLARTATLDIGNVTLTGLAPYDNTYPINGTLTLSGYNIFTGQGNVEISGAGIPSIFGTFSNFVTGASQAPFSLSRVTTDIALNYPTSFPAGLPNVGTLSFDYYLDIIPPSVGGYGNGQLVLNAAVPEPASLAMASIGLVSALGYVGLRRRKAARA